MINKKENTFSLDLELFLANSPLSKEQKEKLKELIDRAYQIGKNSDI